MVKNGISISKKWSKHIKNDCDMSFKSNVKKSRGWPPKFATGLNIIIGIVQKI